MLSAIASNSPPTIQEKEISCQTKMSFIIDKFKDIVSTLPKHKSWLINQYIYKYEGFWYHQGFWYHSKANFSIEITLALQDEFQAQPTNILLASHPKSGTTWLKALAFAIANRTTLKNDTNSTLIHPLLKTNPHGCVPYIETEIFLNNPSYSNELISTHLPYTSLPKSIITSNCRIVYICRNPKDVFVSFWHFVNKTKGDKFPPIDLEASYESFRRGNSPMGPCWDHVIGYHKASFERPDKVLFLIYEELKKDPKKEVRKLAKFMGYPFNEDEEGDKEIEEIIKLCSFEQLRKVSKENRPGDNAKPKVIPDDAFFRKGETGDSVNHLTMEMIQTLDKITLEKYESLNISF